MDRDPVVAGRFYQNAPKALYGDVATWLAAGEAQGTVDALCVMAPHAGYVYSGEVAGKTLGQAALPELLLLLGPNHTGRGGAFSLWPDGAWLIPGGQVPVDAALTKALTDADPRIKIDIQAHLHEHSLEVLLPFLKAKNTNTRIAALAVAESRLGELLDVGAALGRLIKNFPEPVGVVVSSDMSHYVPRETARTLDALALDRIAAVDPEGLHAVVRNKRITMCGVHPMTVALAACRELGATQALSAAYADSGDASGDVDSVVGYAGVIVKRP